MFKSASIVRMEANELRKAEKMERNQKRRTLISKEIEKHKATGRVRVRAEYLTEEIIQELQDFGYEVAYMKHNNHYIITW